MDVAVQREIRDFPRGVGDPNISINRGGVRLLWSNGAVYFFDSDCIGKCLIESGNDNSIFCSDSK